MLVTEKRSVVFVSILLFAAFDGGCADTLRPGFCDSNDDCPVAGQVCNKTTYKCQSGLDSDGGLDDSGGQHTDVKPGTDVPACTSVADCTNSATPFCDINASKCVECTGAGQCAANQPICTANKCGACSAEADCVTRSDGLKACDVNTGACVACVKDADCGGTTPVCDPNAHQCVQCMKSSHCSGNAPICGSDKKCAKCTASAECGGLADPARQFCNVGSGACVQCLDSESCTGTTPFCAANACVSCAGDDAKCVGGKAEPGVCMLDGHCATQPEVIYVKYTPMCDATPTGGDGTAAAPFCTVNASAQAKLSANRSVFLVRGVIGERVMINASPNFVTIVVGQQDAELAASTGSLITVTGGNVMIRNLTVTGGRNSDGIKVSGGNTTLSLKASTIQKNNGIGISASSGATLAVSQCVIKENSGGGIFIDGASFEILESKVEGNGPGNDGGDVWAGMRIKNVPSTGSKAIQRTSILSNKQIGVTCSANVAGMGVLATGNIGGIEISPTCGFTSCGSASATCGAP